MKPKATCSLSLLLALASLVGTSLSGCRSESFSDLKLNSFTQPLTSDPGALDPTIAYDQSAWAILPNIYETLFQFAYLKDPYEIEPLLAADFPTISKDGKTLTIPLQRGVRFQPDPSFGTLANEGRELTAHDFIYSLKRLALPQLQPAGWALLKGRIEGLDEFHAQASKAASLNDALKAPVSGLSAPDAYTLRIRLTRPFPRLLQILTLPFTAAVPREVVEAYADENGVLRDKAVGTGPFRLEKRLVGKLTILKRHPDYRPVFFPIDSHPRFVKQGFHTDSGKRLPFLDALFFPVVSQESHLWERFLAGELDSYSPPEERLSKILTDDRSPVDDLKKKGIKAEFSSAESTFALMFNLKDDVLGSNKALRQAIASAIPREEFISRFAPKLGIKANSSVPPNIPGGPAKPVVFYGYDISRAKRLLKKAGYAQTPPPLLRLDLPGAGAEDRRMGEFLRSTLARVGIHVQVIYNHPPGYLAKLRSGKFQISVNRQAVDFPDAENVFQKVFGSSKGTDLNFSRMDHQGLNTLFTRLTQTETVTERVSLAGKIEEVIQEELPWVTIHHITQAKLVHPWVINFRGNDMLLNRYKYYRVDPQMRSGRSRFKEK